MENPAGACLNIAEVQAYNLDGTNVALASNGATATASSIYGSRGPEKAIDGHGADSAEGRYSHTNLGVDAWLQVTFQYPRNITSAKIINRSGYHTNGGTSTGRSRYPTAVHLYDERGIIVSSQYFDTWPTEEQTLSLATDSSWVVHRGGSDDWRYTMNAEVSVWSGGIHRIPAAATDKKMETKYFDDYTHITKTVEAKKWIPTAAEKYNSKSFEPNMHLQNASTGPPSLCPTSHRNKNRITQLTHGRTLLIKNRHYIRNIQ